MEVVKVLMITTVWFGPSLCLKHECTMVVDVVKSYERPTAVLAKVCWKLSDIHTLMVELMKTNKSVSFISDQKEIQKFDAKDTIIVIDLNCQDIARLLQEANDSKLYGNVYRWLVIGKTNKIHNNIIPTELTRLEILVNSEVILANKTLDDTFILKFIYRIGLTSEFRTEEFGIWTATEGLKLSEAVARNSFVARRKDLQGKPIATSYVITDNRTRTKLNELQDLKLDNLAKVTHHNLRPLYYFMNATEIMLFTDTWGYFINNSWNGMIGDMVNGQAELSGTVSFMNLKRFNVVQYMAQPTHIKAKFVFREPALSFQNNLFILPFRSTVWMCSGTIVVILTVVIYINAKWEAEKNKDSMVTDSRILKPNVADISLFVIGAIAQQGSSNGLNGSLGRVVTFLMLLIFLFLYTSYSANIVALLQSSSNQIRTLTDLLNSRLELGVEDQKYNRYYFPTATDPVRKAIYQNKVANTGYKPNFMSLDEGVRRLRNKDVPFAFLMNDGMGYKIVAELFLEHEKCGLHEISYYPYSVPWLFSRKASPYKEIYKVGLARTIEHGLADRVNRMFYARKPSCNSGGGSFASVNMVDFHPVLLWMLYGMILSVFLLVIEILIYRMHRKRENSMD